MTIEQHKKSVEACIDCATVCNHCAVSCLEEKEVQYLTKCIRLSLECAIICRAAAELMNVGSFYSRQLNELCATMCNACAQLCEQHANMGMEHCRECVEACRACAKELMDMYENEAEPDSDTKTAIVHEDECAILARASAELMSLESAYCKEICTLTATVCNVASENFEADLTKQKNHSNHRALISNEVKQHLENLEPAIINTAAQGTAERDKQNVQQKGDNKKKHSSALFAASMWRSPVGHAKSHVKHDVRGHSGLENTGPFTNYEV